MDNAQCKSYFEGKIMGVSEKKPSEHTEKLSPLWVSTTILDVFVHSSAIISVLKALARFGHKPSLIAVRSLNKFPNENSPDRIISVPLRFFPIISPLMFTVILMFFLPIYILYSRSDYIIFNPEVHILSCFSSIIPSKLRNVKLVLDIRTIPVETNGIHGFLRHFFFATSILIAKKLFDGITVITPSMKEKICADFSLNSENVGVWTSGVSEDLFNSKKYISESAELRKKFGLKNNFVVFYHGVFTKTRGLTETIKAMQILKNKNLNVFLFLLGSGPMAAELKTLIRDKDLQDMVIVHEKVEHTQVPKFIGFCDVGIVPLPDHPYWKFQSPLKLLEYLSMEKVAIITDILAHRAIIGNERCGVYLSSIKPIEISNAIEYAYHNREQLEEWGRIGRKIIQKNFTWNIVAKDLENYLLSIDKLRKK